MDLMESLDAVQLKAELAGLGRQLLAHTVVGKIRCLLTIGVNKDVCRWLEKKAGRVHMYIPLWTALRRAADSCIFSQLSKVSVDM